MVRQRSRPKHVAAVGRDVLRGRGTESPNRMVEYKGDRINIFQETLSKPPFATLNEDGVRGSVTDGNLIGEIHIRTIGYAREILPPLNSGLGVSRTLEASSGLYRQPPISYHFSLMRPYSVQAVPERSA